MALKRRQIAIILSVAWLGLLTILAAYALHSTNTHSLPIPNALSALTLALPPIAGITIETTNALTTALASSPKHRRSEATSTIPPILLPSTLTVALLLTYETVIATLAGTRITPIDGLGCNLQEKWTDMWRGKEEGVRRIQDAFRCCGFRTGRDMAWPFPDAQHGADACVVRYGAERASGCLEGWRGEERKVAGMMLFVALGVFVWMVSGPSIPALHAVEKLT
ncbi:hypothetical protein BDZ85DRAFT_229217 [Elsinoe ampelina]|uniref:Uncharacterized protein n=1 Tax=Elsinoe ampelina TaxID=302913 RepID=A0A6A6GRR8_9PEZI|nr:hypothetical protein BDZ85DRAFT_229217 [Elsinoe ampelina]